MMNKKTSSAKPISRNSLLWLLVAQVFLLAPHFFTIPIWIMLVWFIVAFWRWKIFQGAWNYPTKLQKTIFVMVCCAGLVLSLGKQFSLEAMISLLVTGFVLKLLEIKQQKDVVLLIFIAIFLLPTQFLFFNDLLSAFYGIFCLILLLTALNKLYQTETTFSPWRSIRAHAAMLLQAIPFMLLLFVVMPRLGSFWAVPSPHQAKTGMSDSMSPGDFTQLMQSDAVAFRVSFDDVVPAPEQRYWRSLVFTQFDGKCWSQSRQQNKKITIHSLTQKNVPWLNQIVYGAEKIRYSIIAEPSGQPWLFSLAAPEQWNNVLELSADLVLRNSQPVIERMSYRVMSAMNYQLAADELPAADLQQNLQLPQSGNSETREKAKAWLDETGSTEKLIEKLLNYYHNSFAYTLSPPQMGVNYIDDFLWKNRQGFCEHFSSSFVFFLRAAGIPARVVVGYQGGDINSVDGYLSVRQRDAHAWSEVWIKGRGWVRFDPTAAVAPERIQKGISESLSASDRQLLAKPFGSSFKLLMKVRDQIDALNYQWVRWVMNYNEDSQAMLFSRLLDDVNPVRIAMLVMGAGVVIMLCIFLVLFLRTRKATYTASQQFFQQLCQKLKPCGIELHAGEAPGQFIERVIQQRPDLSTQLTPIGTLFEQFTYAEERSIQQQLKQLIASFSPKK